MWRLGDDSVTLATTLEMFFIWVNNNWVMLSFVFIVLYLRFLYEKTIKKLVAILLPLPFNCCTHRVNLNISALRCVRRTIHMFGVLRWESAGYITLIFVRNKLKLKLKKFFRCLHLSKGLFLEFRAICTTWNVIFRGAASPVPGFRARGACDILFITPWY